MQKASKKFDERLQTITKIRNPKKKKFSPENKVEYYQTFQLPTITNTLTFFTKKDDHSPLKYKNIFSNKSNKKLPTQLDSIISGALKHYKNQKVNKIIFASPISNRISLGKTYYRSSRFTSNDDGPASYQSQEKSSFGNRRLKQNLNLNSLRIMKESKELTKVNHQQYVNHYENNSERNTIIDPDFSMFYTSPQGPPPPIAKRVRKPVYRCQKGKTNEELSARYSPWRSQERQEELIL